MTKNLDIMSNQQLVEELAQAIATDDSTAAGVAGIAIVGKVLDLVERHVVATEKHADAMAQIAELLLSAVHHEGCGIFVKPR